MTKASGKRGEEWDDEVKDDAGISDLSNWEATDQNGICFSKTCGIFTHSTQSLEHSSDLILFKWVNVNSCDPCFSYISALSKIFSGDSKKALTEAVWCNRRSIKIGIVRLLFPLTSYMLLHIFLCPAVFLFCINATFSKKSCLTSRSQEKERSQVLLHLFLWLSEFSWWLETHKSLPFLSRLPTNIFNLLISDWI